MTEPTTAAQQAAWRSIWRDTVSEIVEGEVRDAEFGLRLIADVGRLTGELEQARGLLGRCVRCGDNVHRLTQQQAATFLKEKS